MCYHVHVENRIASLVVDATDAELLAQFWAGALGWQVVNRGSYGVSIGVDDGPFEIDFRFVPDGPKLTKNRLHLDIKPVHRDQAAELGRLLATDPHAPGEFRCNQIVRNLNEFYGAFDVGATDKLWLEPAARVRIW